MCDLVEENEVYVDIDGEEVPVGMTRMYECEHPKHEDFWRVEAFLTQDARQIKELGYFDDETGAEDAVTSYYGEHKPFVPAGDD